MFELTTIIWFSQIPLLLRWFKIANILDNIREEAFTFAWFQIVPSSLIVNQILPTNMYYSSYLNNTLPFELTPTMMILTDSIIRYTTLCLECRNCWILYGSSASVTFGTISKIQEIWYFWYLLNIDTNVAQRNLHIMELKFH